MRPTSPGGFSMSDGVDAVGVSGDRGGTLSAHLWDHFPTFFGTRPSWHERAEELAPG